MSSFFQQELKDFKSSAKNLNQDLLNYLQGIEFGPSTLYDPSKWDSMVHYWPLDGNGNDVVGDYNFTTEGAPTYDDADAIGGKHIQTDGSDDRLIMSDFDTSNFPDSEFSISLWSKHPFSDIVSKTIFQVYNVTDDNPTIEISTTAYGNLEVDVTNVNSNQFLTDSSTDITQWYHAVGTYSDSANEFKLFVNDSLIETSTFSDAYDGPLSLGSTTDMYIGYYNTSFDDNDKFTEIIADEIAIFDKALSSSEVSELYNAGV